MSAVLLLFLTAVGGALAAMAQWGRKNRRAEITLYVVLLAVSFMAAGVGVLSGLGLVAAVARGSVAGIDAPLYVGAGISSIGGGLAAVYLSLRQILRLRRNPSAAASDASDPPTFLALWLIVVVLSNNVSGLLAYTASPEELGVGLASAAALSPAGVLLSSLPLLAGALFGVGLFVNRSPREVLARLGYGSLSARQVGVTVLFGVIAYGLSIAAETLFLTVQPGLSERVGTIPQNIANLPNVDPLLGIPIGIFVGVALAIGEETLWRGAVQPVFGIVVAALVTTSLGIQYGLSPVLVFLFFFSLALGLLRRRTNTTASCLAHAVFYGLVICGSYVAGG